MPAKEKIISARTALVLDEPFFGALALGLRLQEDAGCGTAWTDGRSLGYDPAFIEGLSHVQTVALIAHEVMHCANGHPWRRDNREPRRWNVATDKAINQTLADAKFTLPSGALYAEGDEVGKSAEWIYARLPESQQGGKGQGEAKPDPLGEVRDAPTGADPDTGEAPPTEADWQQMTAQAAAAAKARGNLPSSLDRFAKEVMRPRVDWRSVLRRFVQEHAKSDYSWSKPNRRYMASGLYLPALDSIELGEIAIAVDTSGSIDSVGLAQAKAELEAVIDECKPAAVTVYYADAKVAQADRFERDEPIVWRPKGGGGTDFEPAIKAAEAQDTPPACMVYLTDLMGCFGEPPSFPVLWVTDSNRTAPFGEVVAMS